MNDLYLSLADFCELAAVAWRFPTATLAAGLLDGSYCADLRACLEELELRDAAALADSLQRAAEGESEGCREQLFEALRTDYTMLFLVPKKEKVYLYESLFRYPKEERLKDYSMFVSPCALHVEQLYRQAGLAVKQSVREPADHFATELEFLSDLYRMAGTAPEKTLWLDRARVFRKTHLDKWLTDFLSAVGTAAALETYRILAKIGGLIADVPGTQNRIPAGELPEP